MGLFDIFKKNKEHEIPQTAPKQTLVAPTVDSSKEQLLSTLSKRERDVFELLITGIKLQEVADALKISYATANTHQTAIYKKLGVNSRAKLIVEYKN